MVSRSQPLQIIDVHMARTRTETSCDVFRVEPHHYEIHARLENWARWSKSDGRAKQMSPMFRQYRSNWRQWHEPENTSPIYDSDAWKVEKVVMSLPTRFKDLLLWYYIWKAPVHAAQRAFASTQLNLWLDVSKAREMVDNRLRE